MQTPPHDPPSTQLHTETLASVTRSLSERRPLLIHLNADTSWLLALPRPSVSAARSGRHWFNILIDPWLSGSQSDVASWFSQQWHAEAPALSSVAAVEELCADIERLSPGPGRRKEDVKRNESRNGGRDEHAMEDIQHEARSMIDAIAISHEFTDHCHKETLLECHPDTPVFATAQAAKLVQSWGHFRTVLETPAFGKANPDWRDISEPPLPEWLAIGRLVTEKDALYYHSALIVAFDCKDAPRRKWSARYSNGAVEDGNTSDGSAEAVIYTPHGIHAPSLEVIPQAQPPIQTLALLHGLHDIALPKQQLNIGAHNGLKAQRLLRAKYWFGTHDEVKQGYGIVSWLLRRKIISLEEALKLERDAGNLTDGEAKAVDDVSFLDLANGESKMLL